MDGKDGINIMYKYNNLLIAPILIPNQVISRYNDDIGEYIIFFNESDIIKLKDSFTNNNFSKMSINHTSVYVDSYIEDSFIINNVNRKSLPKDLKRLPNGTWILLISYKDIKINNLKGLSIEYMNFVKKKDGTIIKIKECLKKMNKSDLGFDIYIHGGGTYGYGRREHGDAHFEIKQINTGKKLSKINFPDKEKWINFTSKERYNYIKKNDYIGKLTKENINKFIDWLVRDNFNNFYRCIEQWNKSNIDNNRANQY